MESGLVALIITGAMLVLYITELLPIAVTSVLACVAMAVAGILPPADAFAGFGNDIVFMLAGMMIVGASLFETGAAGVIGGRIVALVGKNERGFLAAFIVFSIPFSAFLSNTATASILLPVVASAVAASGGKLTRKNTYMTVGIACVAGGGLTLVSSTPQLIAQGLLREGGYETIGFFEPGYTGLPILALLIIYMVTIGFKLQKRAFAIPENTAGEVLREPESGDNIPISPKTGGAAGSGRRGRFRLCVSLGVLVLCVVGFITGIWPPGVVSMFGALVCIATGCLPRKKVFEKIDWTTIVLLGCSFSIASGLDESGGGRIIARGMIALLGDGVSPWMLFASLALVAVILTNFMSSTATGALLAPIAILTAVEMGYDAKSAALAVAIAANVGYATPISTPPMAMTLTAGYRFRDYIKVGGLFNLLAYILLVLLMPLTLRIH